MRVGKRYRRGYFMVRGLLIHIVSMWHLPFELSGQHVVVARKVTPTHLRHKLRGGVAFTAPLGRCAQHRGSIRAGGGTRLDPPAFGKLDEAPSNDGYFVNVSRRLLYE